MRIAYFDDRPEAFGIANDIELAVNVLALENETNAVVLRRDFVTQICDVKKLRGSLSAPSDPNVIELYVIHAAVEETLRQEGVLWDFDLFIYDLEYKFEREDEKDNLFGLRGARATANERPKADCVSLLTSKPAYRDPTARDEFRLPCFTKEGGSDPSERAIPALASWIWFRYRMELERKRNAFSPLGLSDISLELARTWNLGGLCIIGHGFAKSEIVLSRGGWNFVDRFATLRDVPVGTTPLVFDANDEIHVGAAIADAADSLRAFYWFLSEDARFASAREAKDWPIVRKFLIDHHYAFLLALDGVADDIGPGQDGQKLIEDLYDGGDAPRVEIAGRRLTIDEFRSDQIKTHLVCPGTLEQHRRNASEPCIAHLIEGGLRHSTPTGPFIVVTREVAKAIPKSEVFVPRRSLEALFAEGTGLIRNLSRHSASVEILVKEVELKPGLLSSQRVVHSFLIVRWTGESLGEVRRARGGNYRGIEWLAPIVVTALAQTVYRLYVVSVENGCLTLRDLSAFNEPVLATDQAGVGWCVLERAGTEVRFEGAASAFQNSLVFEIMSCRQS